MCEKCAEAVKLYFPDCPDEEYGNFLMSSTAFPACDGDRVAEQLKEHKEAGCKTWLEAIDRAARIMDEVIAELRERGEWPDG